LGCACGGAFFHSTTKGCAALPPAAPPLGAHFPPLLPNLCSHCGFERTASSAPPPQRNLRAHASGSDVWTHVTVVVMPPRGVKAPITLHLLGRHAATKSSSN